MKKYFYYLFALTAMVMFSSCIDNNDEPSTKQTFSGPINSRAIDGDNVVFSQGKIEVEVNFTDNLIKFTTDFKDADGQSHTLTTPEMQMRAISTSTYEFTTSMSQQVGSNFGESLGGYLDIATGMMWFTINSGSSQVVCSTHLLYAYTNTTITNPDNGNHGTHQESAYYFTIDAKGETCTLIISNFICNMNDVVEHEMIQFDGLTLTPTTTGYAITADMVESTSKVASLTDVNFILNNQCQVINGSFKCNGLEFNVTGSLFSLSQQ